MLTSGITGYFAKWSEKETPIDAVVFEGESRDVDLMFNNIIEDNLGSSGLVSNGINATILKKNDYY